MPKKTEAVLVRVLLLLLTTAATDNYASGDLLVPIGETEGGPEVLTPALFFCL